jgi:hypothetical protein
LLVRGWQPRSEDLELPPGVVLVGVVKDPSGRPLAGAQVTAYAWSRSLAATRSSGVDGRFRFQGLPTGDITVYAAFPDHPSGAGVKRVVRGGGTEVVMTLDPGLIWSGSIENWGRRAAGEATLIREGDPVHPWRNTVWFEGGRFRFTGVRADATYTLWIPPHDDGMLCLRQGLTFTGKGLVVRLVHGKAISGRVICPEQGLKPIVYAVGQGIHLGFAEVDPSGRYEFHCMPAGNWTVVASASTLDRTYEGSVTVAAGDSADIELTLQPIRER